MTELQLRQAVKRNIEARLGPDKAIRSPNALADVAGVSQTHLAKALRLEAALTTDFLAPLAKALKCQPWELLVDDDENRKEALARLLR